MTKARKKDCTALTALTITATTAAAINDESDGSVVMRQCKMQQDIHSRNSWKLKKYLMGSYRLCIYPSQLVYHMPKYTSSCQHIQSLASWDTANTCAKNLITAFSIFLLEIKNLSWHTNVDTHRHQRRWRVEERRRLVHWESHSREYQAASWSVAAGRWSCRSRNRWDVEQVSQPVNIVTTISHCYSYSTQSIWVATT